MSRDKQVRCLGAVSLPLVGWREWVTLPDLCSHPMNAKIDTGARTSALHAFALTVDDLGDGAIAHFVVQPHQNSAEDAVEVAAPVDSFRSVRSSNGREEIRPVITIDAQIGDIMLPLEVTLTARDHMGFRMLLGRAAIRRRFLVDPGRSYLQSSSDTRLRRQT